MKRVTLSRNPYGTGNLIAGKYTFTEGVTVLVGKNGSGKSTVLRMLEPYLAKKGIVVEKYDNLHDGGNHALQAAVWEGELDAVFKRAFHSEGEQIITNIGDFVMRIGKRIRAMDEGQELWVLGDAMDSGLSINNVLQLKNVMEFMAADAKRKKIKFYVVVSANTFALARNARCIDVTTGTKKVFLTYSQFEDFIVG
ncbi:MAG: ATP-binding cassette domain-containing protein [Phascolarctobacterium sp.]|nr:ATP-binding cassette domain-containing protein [Phascolarctobacterium sp.]